MILQSASAHLLLRALPSESQRGLSVANASLLRPETVLSAANRKSCVERLRLYKTSGRREAGVDGTANKAAVLVPLCLCKGELGLLYTLRSSKMTLNRGQVSFPGGMSDKNDRDLAETALRETWEELGIPKEKVDVWTTGNLIARKNVSVMPVLGYVGELDPGELRVNHDEVDEAFVLSLRDLCDETHLRFTQFRDSYTLPAYLAGRHRVWGLTAAITHMVLGALVPAAYKHRLVFLPTIAAAKKETAATS